MKPESITEEVLSDLALADEAVGKRIDEALSGVDHEDHLPGVLMREALHGGSPDAERAFIKEYRWAVALLVHQERSATGEREDVLTIVAEDALFIAAETYDPTEEPNFLKHLSASFLEYLREGGWEGADNIITPDVLDIAVRARNGNEVLQSSKDSPDSVPIEASRVLEAVAVHFDLTPEEIVNDRSYKVVDARRTALYFMAEYYNLNPEDIQSVLSFRLHPEYAESALFKYQRGLETDTNLQNTVAEVTSLLEAMEASDD